MSTKFRAIYQSSYTKNGVTLHVYRVVTAGVKPEDIAKFTEIQAMQAGMPADQLSKGPNGEPLYRVSNTYLWRAGLTVQPQLTLQLNYDETKIQIDNTANLLAEEQQTKQLMIEKEAELRVRVKLGLETIGRRQPAIAAPVAAGQAAIENGAAAVVVNNSPEDILAAAAEQAAQAAGAVGGEGNEGLHN